MTGSLRDALERGVVLSDGAVGSQLLQSGFGPRDWRGREGCCEVLNLSRPEQVRAVHESYLDAGAEVVTTNTFLALRSALAARELAGEQRAIVEAAVREAREAVRAFEGEGPERFVAGSIGPGLERPGAGEVGAYADEVEALAGLLLAGGCDALVLETQTDAARGAAGCAAARRAVAASGRDAVVALSFPLTAGGLLLSGEPLEAAVDALDAPPDVLALNCVVGPDALAEPLARLRARYDGVLGAWPNAGLPEGEPPFLHWPVRPEPFAESLAALALVHGLRLVGGCCGTGPAHVRQLARALGRAVDEDEVQAD